MPHLLVGLLRTVMAIIALVQLSLHSQLWPSKPVRIIAPYPPGGPGDIPPRAFGQAHGQTVSEMLGQPFVIENRLGADGIIGAEACAKAPADLTRIQKAGHPRLLTGPGSVPVMTIRRNRSTPLSGHGSVHEAVRSSQLPLRVTERCYFNLLGSGFAVLG